VILEQHANLLSIWLFFISKCDRNALFPESMGDQRLSLMTEYELWKQSLESKGVIDYSKALNGEGRLNSTGKNVC
jgi:hypothetical protein